MANGHGAVQHGVAHAHCAAPGGHLANVRIELATRAEARTAINQIYRDVLRREADPTGLNAQMAALRSGLTLVQIRQAIAESPQGWNRRYVRG